MTTNWNMTYTLSDAAKARRSELDLVRVLPELLTHHLEERPDLPIYTFWQAADKTWRTITVKETCATVERWRRALVRTGLTKGDRCAMLLPNCIEAVYFDQSVLANALVPVPLHAVDTAGSSSYILNDSGAKLLVTSRLNRWEAVRDVEDHPALKTVVVTGEPVETHVDGDVRVMGLEAWLAGGEGCALPEGPAPQDLAALVYTSGTTGRPKGVMLTHRAILANVTGVLRNLCPEPDDVWLSFLPLSHTFERTTTYYTALGCGNRVAFNRNIGLLAEDMKTVRPTVMMSVPRIYEKVYDKIQDQLVKKPPFVQKLFHAAVAVGYRRFCRQNGLPVPRGGWLSVFDPLIAGFLDKKVGAGIRGIFGGRPRIFIAGGAAFNPEVSRTFIGLGVNILQGYGMTETAPIMAVNKIGDNHPLTVGPALVNIEVRVGENDELQMRGPSLMAGYWNRQADTRAAFTEDGWLKTGDQADIFSDGHIRIKGRIKEIIVTSTGEKVPPADLEQAIEACHLVSQAMVIGENRPYIAALVVLNPEQWRTLAAELQLDPSDPSSLQTRTARQAVLRRVKDAAKGFPNYAVPRQVRLYLDPWTIENGLLTPTLKLKRGPLRARFADDIDRLYDEVKV